MRKYILILTLFISQFAYSQMNYKSGIFPSISTTFDLPKTWELNFGVENRNTFFKGRFDQAPSHQLELERIDFTPIISRNVGIDKEAGVGYMLRVRNNEIYHRWLQQISFVEKYLRFRMGYRIRTDQTLNPDQSMTFRLRIRTAMELPLQGTKLDYKEFYFKISLEQVLYYTQKEFDYGARTLFTPGYYLNNQHKFEFGLNHRFSKVFVNDRLDQQFWLSLSWYFKPKWKE